MHHTLARVYLASGHADWAAVEQKRAEEEQPACDTVPVACAYLTGKLEDVIARTAAASQPTALYWRARAANDLAVRILRDAGEAAAVCRALRGACGNRPRSEPAARSRDAVA